MADNDEVVETPAKGPGLMTLVKAIAFVSVIVLIEVAAASMFIPSESETEEIAAKLAAADAAKEDSSEGEISTEEKSTEPLATEDMREVSLDAFHVVAYNRDSGTSLNVDFKLFGLVLADEENEFMDLYTASTKRISEQISITVRGTDPADLTDPGLGLIKRKILEKTNRALGKPLLHEVIFSEFSFTER
ncbi:MAG: hypothetical protein GXP26_13625 [Planctomycetes bacterium]|nr:hypothetical protein [Planctomycetota bacterium]